MAGGAKRPRGLQVGLWRRAEGCASAGARSRGGGPFSAGPLSPFLCAAGAPRAGLSPRAGSVWRGGLLLCYQPRSDAGVGSESGPGRSFPAEGWPGAVLR